MRSKCLSFLGLFILISASCKDESLDQVMEEYCNCIDENQESMEERHKCIKIMDSLQKVHANDHRKLNLIVEKAGECL